MSFGKINHKVLRNNSLEPRLSELDRFVPRDGVSPLEFITLPIEVQLKKAIPEKPVAQVKIEILLSKDVLPINIQSEFGAFLEAARDEHEPVAETLKRVAFAVSDKIRTSVALSVKSALEDIDLEELNKAIEPGFEYLAIKVKEAAEKSVLENPGWDSTISDDNALDQDEFCSGLEDIWEHTLSSAGEELRQILQQTIDSDGKAIWDLSQTELPQSENILPIKIARELLKSNYTGETEFDLAWRSSFKSSQPITCFDWKRANLDWEGFYGSPASHIIQDAPGYASENTSDAVWKAARELTGGEVGQLAREMVMRDIQFFVEEEISDAPSDFLLSIIEHAAAAFARLEFYKKTYTELSKRIESEYKR